MAYPTRLLSDGEQIETEFRPHWRAILGPIFLIVGAIAIAVLGSIFTQGTTSTVLFGVAALVVLAGAVLPLTRWWFTSYVVTNERLIARSGILSRQGKEIPLEVINDVSFSQSIGERMFRSGDVVIESAGEHGQSRFTDVPDPEGLQSQVYRLREARIRDLGAQTDPVGNLEALARLHKDGILTDEEFAEKKSKLLGEI